MKNFDEIYQKLYYECNSDIQQERKKHFRNKLKSLALILILSGIVLTIIAITTHPVVVLPFLIVALVIIFIGLSNSEKYSKIYKDIVISRLISYYDKDLSFNQKNYISKSEYDSAGFESYEYFSSNDYISGKLDNTINIKIGDVYTYIEETDNNGHTSTTPIFRGLVSIIKLNKSIENKVKILYDQGHNFTTGLNLTLKKDSMKIDSKEFDKIFNVHSQDKILAMRILTSDIMEYMINFKKENRVKFDFIVKDSICFVRVHCEDMFETSLIQNPLEYKTLEKYYKYLNFICELSRKMYYTISEKEF